MRRIIVLLAIAVVTALAAATISAQAATPVHEWVTIDETFTWDDCGFVVEEHDVATLHLTSWFDPSGARTRQVVTAPGARITWTNVATGASVTTVNTYAVHKRDNPDGSATIAFTGPVFVLPGGGGKAYVESGRDLIVFRPGGIEVLSSTGPSADLCEALTATIG
jgi:disulfide bond formation protein DsbB